MPDSPRDYQVPVLSMRYLIASLLVGCVHVTSHSWTDGTRGYTVDCEAKRSDAAGICWRKATALCLPGKPKITAASADHSIITVECIDH